MSNLKHIESDIAFKDELERANNKLIVIDFFATWCGPCKTIAPHFTTLATNYKHVLFFKVNVDKCRGVAQEYGIRAMPTFMILKNKAKLQTLQGGNISNISLIESKIKEYGSQDMDEIESEESVIPGYMNLNSFLTKNSCECLNCVDKHPFSNCLKDNKTFLESDCDEQDQLKMAPKHLKLFINQTRTLDFDQASSWEPVQTIDVTTKELTEGLTIPLKLVKFQNVVNISVFVQSNQEEAETTQINYIEFIGLPMNHTNMSEFKRVAGTKGETHVGM